jgi:hypothetical protein
MQPAHYEQSKCRRNVGTIARRTVSMSQRTRLWPACAAAMLALTATCAIGTGALVTISTDAAAQGRCSDYVTHWGRRADSRGEARENAYAGMEWKLRNQYAMELGVERGIRIDQCKLRDGGYSWQCQASAVVRTCAN